jgi:hypothetical protein
MIERTNLMTTEPDDTPRAAATRMAWICFEEQAYRLVRCDDLDDALDQLRSSLNGTDLSGWWSTGAPPEIDARRRLLLDAVARRLAELRGMDDWPIVTDLVDAPPDDASELDDITEPG